MEPVTSKSVWGRVWDRLDQCGMALEYDPMQELQTRVLCLEDEVRRLRGGSDCVPQQFE